MQRWQHRKKLKIGERNWRPKGEKEALSMLRYLRTLHLVQQRRGGRSHHEQSNLSRAPFDSGPWPWGLSRGANSVAVNGCAVGLTNKDGTLLLKKAWRIESSSEYLLDCLRPYKCNGQHEHGECLGQLWRTACYTRFFASLVAETLVGES